ncbi:hypothetical protein BU25DRAFT_405696 [Macroventuria anomochaeta]|uniref:Uncharacterized protein n=1 Tax=Macroventuria anomochaeta TaxID=301207 RepID=A0ACB6SJD5_9PLEO|nr:uncharacterized protein BU25DRAFT_405696 [Macroventuria anomochaeta]KAF2633850.1 hypothetical protein BU25DRAFT_405696 [Macroventuria anomochaeta]
MTSCARQLLRTSRPRPADPSEHTFYKSQAVLPSYEGPHQLSEPIRKVQISQLPTRLHISVTRTRPAIAKSTKLALRFLSTSTATMSWMDSWSRPSKSQATPPPLYLTIGDSVPYCHSCGRVIGDRKKTSGATEVKYCSQRCRHQKPGPVDRKIEATFAKLLEGATPESIREEQAVAKSKESEEKDGSKELGKEKEKEKGDTADEDEGSKFGKKNKSSHKKKSSKTKNTPKGDHRITIDCTAVEELVFNREKDPEKVYGRRKNRRARFVVEKPEDWKSVDMVDHPPPALAANPAAGAEEISSAEDTFSDSEPEDQGGIALENGEAASQKKEKELGDVVEYGYGGGKVRPPQDQSDINGSIGGEKGWAERQHETEEAKQRRLEGQRRADEREMVRKAARRGCAFGFLTEGEEGVRGGEKGERRKCEAVMKGAVVEASFAKGEWGVRWREKV